jgi:phenylalanyl-tRNA synthetase beta chain
MKVSRHWLQEWVHIEQDNAALAHLLTMGGLEVEAIDSVAPAFSKVVVAQVLTCEKHPQADRLHLCTVQVSSDPNAQPLQIVCGAPNVKAGLKVPCARVGAVLQLAEGKTLEIKEAPVRGVVSSGMLCSAKELGIAEESDGLLILSDDTPVGISLREALDLDDTAFTLKLTPNRGDCLSVKGLAREVSAITGQELKLPVVQAIQAQLLAGQGSGWQSVNLQAGSACPIYLGRVIRLASRPKQSPAWLRQRLERSGIRPIEPVVDATNYGLIALGHPTHAFDHAKLHGQISVRLAQEGEELELLNGSQVKLRTDSLLIADEKGPMALAGVMGGQASSVSEDTQEIFLECAWFDPDAIAGRTRHYTLNSEAAHRFERGVDPAGVMEVMEFVTSVLLDLCGGEAGPVIQSGALPKPKAIVPVRLARIHRVLGLHFNAEEVKALFGRLGLNFAVQEDIPAQLDLTPEQLKQGAHLLSPKDSTVFLVTPPSYRFDLNIEADFIEEVARLHGYDHIPAEAPQGELSLLPSRESLRPSKVIAQSLVQRDYQEVITYSFIDRDWEKDFSANDHPVEVINPIASQMAVMRSSLIGGLVATLSSNLKRRQERVRIFEIGRTFYHQVDENSPYLQTQKLGVLAYGPVVAEQWGQAARGVDFFDVKADLEALAPELEYQAASHVALHPGRTSVLKHQGKEVGWLGELHPVLAKKYDLPHAPILLEIDLGVLERLSLPRFSEPSRFQAVRRDLAVVVDDALPVGDVLSALKDHAPPSVVDVGLFDVYRGTGLPEGKKSLAFSMTLQDQDKTLTDADIEAVTSTLTAVLEQRFQAVLRQ